MSKVRWKGGALLAPVPPVLVSCADGDRTNILTVAWTGIINTIPPKTYISVRPERFSYNMIKNSGEFVLNLTPARLARTADNIGCVSGKDVNKFEKFGLHKFPSGTVACPGIDECPINLECKVTDVVKLGTHDMFIAEITAVNADSSLLDENGKLRIEKAGLCAYAHGTYFELGKKIGTFGFSVKKKKKSPYVKKK